MDMNVVVGIVLCLTTFFVFCICLLGDWAATQRRERDRDLFVETRDHIPSNVPTAVIVVRVDDVPTGVVVHASC